MRRNHIFVCLSLILLALPIFIADRVLLKPSGGGFISLDFRGLFIGGYLIFLAVHLVISTLAVYRFRRTRLLTIHIISAFISVSVVWLSCVIYDRVKISQEHHDYEQSSKDRAQLGQAIELKRWWFVPNETDPKEIDANLEIKGSGRLAGSAQGRDGEASGPPIFEDSNDWSQKKQARVQPGDHFVYVIPLKRNKPGKADQYTITFSLFKSPTGPDKEDISIVYEPNPEREDDGSFLYRLLPPPSVPPSPSPSN